MLPKHFSASAQHAKESPDVVRLPRARIETFYWLSANQFDLILKVTVGHKHMICAEAAYLDLSHEIISMLQKVWPGIVNQHIEVHPIVGSQLKCLSILMRLQQSRDLCEVPIIPTARKALPNESQPAAGF